MFERYTEEARRAIFFARYEAWRLGTRAIETEHLLLGLIRADHALIRRYLPQKLEPVIWMEIEACAPPGNSLPPSADTPLSQDAKRALAYAVEEAELHSRKQTGTDDVLLGLLRVKECGAAQLLARHGLDLERAREARARARERLVEPMTDRHEDTVQIHGELWDADYVSAAAQFCRKFLWEKRPWAQRDALVERETHTLFLHSGQPYDDEQFDLEQGGWAEDHCAICWWRLFHSPEPEHSTGYTNGQDWLCTECFARFIAPARQKNS